MITETEILKKLLSFDTQNFDDIADVRSTDEELDWIADLLDSHGIYVSFQDYFRVNKGEEGEETDPRISRKNLIARISDRDDIPQIGLEGHIDTVPFGDYKGNPLGDVKNGRVYGRGAVDMSGSVACMIHAMISLAKSGGEAQLAANPHLIITSDEEAMNFEGIRRYLEDPSNLSFAICGEPTGLDIKDRFKGALYYVVEVKGKSAHGSRPHEGENAILKGFPVLEKLYDLSSRVPSITSEDFKSDEEHTHMSSMNLGLIEGGTKVNMVPSDMRIEFEMRLVQPLDVYLDMIEEVANRHKDIARFRQMFARGPSVFSIDSDYPLIHKIRDLSDKRVIATGFSEAYFLNKAGIPTLQFGVGEDAMSHQNEEYVEITELERYSGKLVEFLEQD